MSAAIRLGRLSAGLIAWCDAALPGATVVWGTSGFPRRAANETVVVCRTLGGEEAGPTDGEQPSIATLPTSATVRISGSVLSGVGVVLAASGLRWEITTTSTDPEVARDALLAAIGTEPLIAASFTADGTDGIRIDADALGDLHNVWTAGPIEIETSTLVKCETQVADVSTFCEIEAFSADKTLRGGAMSVLSELRARRNLRTHRTIRRDYGIGLERVFPAAVDLKRLAGPDWESRASVSFYVTQISLAAESIEVINRVRGTLSESGGTISLDTGTPP